MVEEIKTALREAGVTVLSNESVPLERGGETILIAGIDDPNGYADQKTPEELAAEVYAACGDPFWILLAHRNNRFDHRFINLRRINLLQRNIVKADSVLLINCLSIDCTKRK